MRARIPGLPYVTGVSLPDMCTVARLPGFADMFHTIHVAMPPMVSGGVQLPQVSERPVKRRSQVETSPT